MDVHKYASPSDFDHTGALTALMAELKRVEADSPRKALAKWAEPSPQAHLDRFSSSTILQRVMAESKTWARSVREAIEGDGLTTEALHGFQTGIAGLISGLNAAIEAKPGSEEAEVAQRLKDELSDPDTIIARLLRERDEAEERASRLEERASRLEERASRLEAHDAVSQKTIADLSASNGDLLRLLASTHRVESLPEPKLAKPSKKRETPAWKPQHAFRQDAEKFLRRVEFGAGQLSLKLNKDEPVFRAPDLWKAMRAEKIQIFRQAEKTLNLYSSNVLKDQGYIMPPGKPKEVSGLSGVDFLVECFRAGKKIAEHAEETLKTPPAAKGA